MGLLSSAFPLGAHPSALTQAVSTSPAHSLLVQVASLFLSILSLAVTLLFHFSASLPPVGEDLALLTCVAWIPLIPLRGPECLLLLHPLLPLLRSHASLRVSIPHPLPSYSVHFLPPSALAPSLARQLFFDQ